MLRETTPSLWQRAGWMSVAATAAVVALVVFVVLPRFGSPTRLSAAQVLERSLQTLATGTWVESLDYELTIDGKKTRKKIGKRDQFAPELLYFSDCILRNRQPEPSGEEGLQDVRIVQAMYESAETGKAVEIPTYASSVPSVVVRTRTRPRASITPAR